MSDKVDRRRSARQLVSEHIEGEVVPGLAPIILRDINDDGFAVRIDVNLIRGSIYRCQFGQGAEAIAVTGRLMHSMRMSTGEGSNWFLAGFQFAEREREGAEILRLMDRVGVGKR